MTSLSIEMFRNALFNTPRTTIFEWCGYSEAFMNPHTPEMIQMAWRKGRRIQVSTTLVGLTDEGSRKLRGIKFDKFVVHIPDSNNFIFNEKLWVDRWLQSLRNLDKAVISFQALGPVSEDIMYAIRDYGRYENIPRIDDKRSMYSENAFKLGPVKCTAYCKGGSYLFLWPNGNLSYCSLDFGYESVIGNLSEHHLYEIMNGELMKKYEASMRSVGDPILCRSCPYAMMSI